MLNCFRNSFTLLLLVKYLNCKLLHIQIWSDCFGTIFLNSKNRFFLFETGAQCIDQADLELTEIYLSVSQVLRLKVCATMTGIKFQSIALTLFLSQLFIHQAYSEPSSHISNPTTTFKKEIFIFILCCGNWLLDRQDWLQTPWVAEANLELFGSSASTSGV